MKPLRFRGKTPHALDFRPQEISPEQDVAAASSAQWLCWGANCFCCCTVSRLGSFTDEDCRLGTCSSNRTRRRPRPPYAARIGCRKRGRRTRTDACRPVEPEVNPGHHRGGGTTPSPPHSTLQVVVVPGCAQLLPQQRLLPILAGVKPELNQFGLHGDARDAQPACRLRLVALRLLNRPRE